MPRESRDPLRKYDREFWGDVAVTAAFLIVGLGVVALANICRGQELRRPDRQPQTCNRFQLFERLAWQWVPPESRIVNGHRLSVAGHWHRRGQPCCICGDRTRRGAAANVPPAIVLPVPGPASQPTQLTPSPVRPTPIVLPDRETTPVAPEICPVSNAGQCQAIGDLQSQLAAASKNLTERISDLETQLTARHNETGEDVAESISANTRAMAALAEVVEQNQRKVDALESLPATTANAERISAPSYWDTATGGANLLTLAAAAGLGATGIGLPAWLLPLVFRVARRARDRRRRRRTVAPNIDEPAGDGVAPDQPFRDDGDPHATGEGAGN